MFTPSSLTAYSRVAPTPECFSCQLQINKNISYINSSIYMINFKEIEL